VWCLRSFEYESQPAVAGGNDLDIYEGEADSTSEMGAGQFSIFGAIEEKTGHGFSRMNTDEETTSRIAFVHWIAVVSGKRQRAKENLIQWAAGISTEGAQEMQKGKVSGFQGFRVSGFQGFRVSGFQEEG
jgi:hypothetical protein